MKSVQRRQLIVICLTVVALSLIGLTWYAPWWPLFVFELTILTLLCPGYNALGSSCSGNHPAHYMVLSGLLLAVLAIVVLLVRRRRARRAAASGRTSIRS